MARLEAGQNKKQELPVKKSSSDGVAAGKTVTRPVHKGAVNERPMPMNNNLQPFVQQHAAGNSNDQGHERGPPSFPHKKQHQRKHDKTDPLPGSKIGERAQHAHKCRGQALVEPSRKLVIRSSKGISQGERRHKILGEKKCVCHKETLSVYLRKNASQLIT